VDMVCKVFGICRSSFYDYQNRCNKVDIERLNLRVKVKQIFTASRNAAGSRTIVTMLAEQGIKIGRCKVSRLMSEGNLESKQPGLHKYKHAVEERPDIPNRLNRQFNMASRACKPFCVTASLNIVPQTVFEQDSKSAQGLLPVSYGHSPLF